jgi:hypothetical protein
MCAPIWTWVPSATVLSTGDWHCSLSPTKQEAPWKQGMTDWLLWLEWWLESRLSANALSTRMIKRMNKSRYSWMDKAKSKVTVCWKETCFFSHQERPFSWVHLWTSILDGASCQGL